MKRRTRIDDDDRLRADIPALAAAVERTAAQLVSYSQRQVARANRPDTAAATRQDIYEQLADLSARLAALAAQLPDGE